METWERQPGPFLRKLDGRIWKAHDLTCVWDLEKNRNEQLAEHRESGFAYCTVCGATVAFRLSRHGLTDHQIGDIVGMSIAMVGRYTRLSVQRENALAAVVQLSQHKSLKVKS